MRFVALTTLFVAAISAFGEDAKRTIPQSEWSANGATPIPGRMQKHTDGISSIVIHHTESPNQPPAMEVGRLVGVQRYHIVDRGWGDIAYHYLIGPSGKIYEGRDPVYQGDSGTKYDLNGRLLVCMIGSFKERLPEPAAHQALVKFVAQQLRKHKLDPEVVVTHRMVAATDCPGDTLQEWFDQEGKETIAKAYHRKPFKLGSVVPPKEPPANTVATSPAQSTENLGDFQSIPSLAIPPIGAEKESILIDRRLRSPDGTCEFGVMAVKVDQLGHGEYDRLITWRSIEKGEKETSSQTNPADERAQKVSQRFGITGPGNSYTRYFQRSYSTSSEEGAVAVLWELMTKDSDSLAKWREAYVKFKGSVDLGQK